MRLDLLTSHLMENCKGYSLSLFLHPKMKVRHSVTVKLTAKVTAHSLTNHSIASMCCLISDGMFEHAALS